MSVTPNMNLTLPDVTVTSGPEWASELNTALNVVDNHDHTSGKGQQVPSAGININEDLSMQGFKLVDVKAAQLEDQPSTLSGALNAGTVYTVGGNIYFTNSGGVPVQITDGDAIVQTVVVPGSPLMPAGALLDFAGSVTPTGFLQCNGAVLSQATYADLYAAIGSSYNTGGEGVGNFRLPDFSGRVSVGSGSYTDTVLGAVTRTIAQIIGAASHILTTPEMPSHTHTQNAHNHGINSGTSGIALAGTFTNGAASASQVSESTIATNQNTGGGGSHNNMQPSLVVMKIIKT